MPEDDAARTPAERDEVSEVGKKGGLSPALPPESRDTPERLAALARSVAAAAPDEGTWGSSFPEEAYVPPHSGRMPKPVRGGIIRAIQFYGAGQARLLNMHLSEADWQELVTDAGRCPTRRID